MSEENKPDTRAAEGLEDTLKEFDAPEPGGDLADLLKEVGDAASAEAKETPDDDEEDEAPAKKEKASVVSEEFGDGEAEDDDEEDAPPAGISKKNLDNWTALKTAKKELKAKYAEADTARRDMAAKVEELQKQLAELPELREKAKFIEDAEKEFALYDVERSKEYRETIKEPLKAIEGQVIAIAKSNEGMSADKLFVALEEPDPVKRRTLLREATEDMDNVDRDDIMQMARDTQALLDKQDKIRARARDAAKETAEAKEVAEKTRVQKAKDEFARAADHVVGELRKRLPFTSLAEDETEDTVYEAIASRVKASEFDGAPMDRKAFAVASAMFLPRAVKELRQARDEIAKLEARLDRKGKSSPKVKGGSAAEPSDGSEGDIEKQIADALGMRQSRTIIEALAE